MFNSARKLTNGLPILISRKFRHIYEPPNIDAKPEFPLLKQICLHIRGFDYVHVEKYGKYAHNTIKNEGLKCKYLASPPKISQIQVYEPNSTKVKDEYSLKKYMRTIEVFGMKAIDLPFVVERLQHNLPLGVDLTVQEADPSIDEFRFVPYLEVDYLQEQLKLLHERKYV